MKILKDKIHKFVKIFISPRYRSPPKEIINFISPKPKTSFFKISDI